MSAESIAEVRQWAADDRAQAVSKRKAVESVGNQVVALRYLSGLAKTPAETAQIQAQAAELEDAGRPDEAAAVTLDATAAGWDTVAGAAEAFESGAVENPDA